MGKALEFAAAGAWPLGPPVALSASKGLLYPVPPLDRLGFLKAFEGATGCAAFSRGALPWRQVADWTHQLGKTPTDTWLDVVDGYVRGPHHRWLRHHPLDFVRAWLGQGAEGQLGLIDYLRHMALDVITLNGLPLLAEQVHNWLVSLGIPAHQLFAWTHVNLFEITVGFISTTAGAHQLFLAITGQMPWQGLKTLLLTFGAGTLDVGIGLYTQNPLLLLAGACKFAAGGVSLWRHLHVPAESLLGTALSSLLCGVGAGTVTAALRIALGWNTSTAPEKVGMGLESIGLAAVLGALGCVSPWLSIPLGVAYGAGKFALTLAREDSAYWEVSPLSSELTAKLALQTVLKYGGEDAARHLATYLRAPPALPLDAGAVRFLTTEPNWAAARPGCAQVFAQQHTARGYARCAEAPTC